MMEYIKQKKKINSFKVFLGCFILAFSVVGLVGGFFYFGILPMSDEEKTISSKKNNYKPVGNASDPENSTHEAFNYWYAPVNSFGVKSVKSINWSYWKSWLRGMFKWRTTASPNLVDWYNADSALKVSVDWNETNNTAKVTLTLNTSAAPTDLYYRFELAVNRSIKEYINKSSNFEYWLTLPANSSEDYNIYFNWSDLKPLIDSGKITVKQKIVNRNNKSFYYFNITSVNKIAPDKEFILDPIFGNQNTGDWYWCYLDGTEYLTGWNYTMGTVGGYADNITIRTDGVYWQKTIDIHCMIYEFVDDTSSYAGSLVGETEVKEITAGSTNTLVTFNFSEPKPHLLADTKYYLIASPAEDETGSAYNWYEAITGGKKIYKTNEVSVPADDPLTGEFYSVNQQIFIYCTYTIGGTPSRSWNNPFDWNISFSNTTAFGNPFDWNISFSNTTGFYNPFDFNFSFSNTSVKTWNNPFDFNFSFSNTSIAGFSNYFDWNISFSNITSWGNPFSFNFSFSNTSVKTWNNPFDWNFSFSNTTAYGNPFDWNISFSNSTPPFPILVTIIYPAENETGIQLQPTLVIGINHSQGSIMNVTWYYGLSAGAENNLIGSDLNIYNSTVTELFYQADNWATQYFLRAYINDGNESINTTWSFYTGLSGQVYISNDIFAVVLIVFLVAAGVFIYIIWRARRKQNENQPPNDPYNIYK